MSKPDILVVDDDEDVSKLIAARLEKDGFQAHAVYSGKEALKYVRKNAIDLILLDLFMPEMDGYEVSNRLRAHKDTADIPIIMLTVKDSTRDKVKALKMGIDDYITKPYEAEELVARIEAVLRKSKIRTAETEAETEGIKTASRKRRDYVMISVAIGKDQKERLMEETHRRSMKAGKRISEGSLIREALDRLFEKEEKKE